MKAPRFIGFKTHHCLVLFPLNILGNNYITQYLNKQTEIDGLRPIKNSLCGREFNEQKSL